MIQAAQNKVICTVKSKYVENFNDILKMASIQNNTSVHLEDLVEIRGTIVSIPRTISNEPRYNGFSTKDLRVGDNVIFSFSVIYDFFPTNPEDKPIHKNLISIHGKEFWQADITKIYAVIRNGKVIMVNGYVMATKFGEDKIFLRGVSKKIKTVKSSQVLYIGNPKTDKKKISVSKNDTIYFNPNKVQKYEIDKNPFIILTQQQVLGSST